jgi:hypothetical protein
LAVALHQAANGIEGAPLAVVGMAAVEVLLDLDLLEKGVDGLLLGIADEAAGVDDYKIAVVLLAVKIYCVMGCGEVAGDILGVDGVFTAA